MDDTPQRTHTPLTFRWHTGTTPGYVADDDTKRYRVTHVGRIWELEIRELTGPAGARHTIGRPVFDSGEFDTKELCTAVANAYSALGDDYQPGEHQGRGRWTEAVQRVQQGPRVRRRIIGVGRVQQGPTPPKRVRVTPVQRAALVTIAADPYAPGVKGVTLDALEAKGLTIPNHDHAHLRWFLTDAGRTLLPAADDVAADPTPQDAATTQEQTPMTTPEPAARFEARTDDDNGNAIVWDNTLNRVAQVLFPSDDSAYVTRRLNDDTRATASLVDGIPVHTLNLTGGDVFGYAVTCNAVHAGDVLVHGEVVAIMYDVAAPYAISVQASGCYRRTPRQGWLTVADGAYAAAYRVAVQVAGWLNVPLAEPVETETPAEPVETPAADTPRYSVREAEPGELGPFGVWDNALNRWVTTGYTEDEADDRRGMLMWGGDTAELVDGIAVFTLDETDGPAAYAFTQCAEQFKSGDVLVFTDVVSIMVGAWPCAITVADRGFHAGLAKGRSWLTMDGGKYADAYRVAVKVAQDRGLALSSPVEHEDGDGPAQPVETPAAADKRRTGPLPGAPEGIEYTPVPDAVQAVMRRRFEDNGITAVHPDRPGWLLHHVANFWDGPYEVKDNGDGTYTYTSPFTGAEDTFGSSEQSESPTTPTDTLRAGVRRCEDYARKGTGHGVCDAILDAHGVCPVAFNHVDSATGGEL